MESQEKVMVHLLLSDRVIHNLSECLIEISSAMHRDKDIYITTNSEGPSLETLTYRVRDNLFKLLDELCEKMSYDPSRIEIETGNLIEDTKSSFRITRWNTGSGWFYGDHLSKIKINKEKQFKHHFGNFVSNSTYPRLLLASYLHTHHRDKTLQTYRRDPRDPGQAVDLDLDKLMFECADPGVLTDVASFLQHLPLELEQGLAEHPMTNMSAGEDGAAINSTIMSWYGSFFCDVITETFFSGRTFFLTEKTTRPLLCRNPFVVHGPKNFLKHLRALGFETFSRYWSEEYDHYEGYERCKKIYEVLREIAQQDTDALHSMHDDMGELLEHNRQRLLSLTDQDIAEFMSQKH
jgi:hypothetical protein